MYLDFSLSFFIWVPGGVYVMFKIYCRNLLPLNIYFYKYVSLYEPLEKQKILFV